MKHFLRWCGKERSERRQTSKLFLHVRPKGMLRVDGGACCHPLSRDDLARLIYTFIITNNMGTSVLRNGFSRHGRFLGILQLRPVRHCCPELLYIHSTAGKMWRRLLLSSMWLYWEHEFPPGAYTKAPRTSLFSPLPSSLALNERHDGFLHPKTALILSTIVPRQFIGMAPTTPKSVEMPCAHVRSPRERDTRPLYIG